MDPNNINNNISLTMSAAEHIKQEINKELAKNNKIIGIKLGITTTGCSGYAYILDFIKENHNLDLVNYHKFNSHDIDIYVDKKSFNYIAGTVVDYKQQGISKTMVFDNPLATALCGCGESFTVDKNK